jgi:glycylpeptide N-tetradecanoyltransferase
MMPLHLQEITRRVNLRNIWQASYTAGVVLPRPVCSCRYWHRSLNPKKLIEVGFSSLLVSGLHLSRRRGVTRCVEAATSQRTPAEKRMLQTAQLRPLALSGLQSSGSLMSGLH